MDNLSDLAIRAVLNVEAGIEIDPDHETSGCLTLMPLTKRGDSRCGRRKYSDTEYCFWHSTVDSKTNAENIESYFGAGMTLVQALENEVKAGNSLENLVLPNINLGGNAVHGGPNLSKARLDGANLNKSSLSYCDLSGASLARANLVNAKLSNCKLDNVNFARAKMFNIKLRNSILSECKGLRRSNFRGAIVLFWRIDRMLEQYPEDAESMYLELTRYFSCRGLFDDASWSAFRASKLRHKQLRQRLRIGHLKMLHDIWKISPGLVDPVGPVFIEWIYAYLAWTRSLVFMLTTGWGERPMRVIASSVGVILSFSLIYDLPGGPTKNFIDALYFSMITFTTVGYGDIVPHGKFRLLAGTEALLGILLVGLFLFCLGRRTVTRA
jgi:hypothetical protein